MKDRKSGNNTFTFIVENAVSTIEAIDQLRIWKLIDWDPNHYITLLIYNHYIISPLINMFERDSKCDNLKLLRL